MVPQCGPSPLTSLAFIQVMCLHVSNGVPPSWESTRCQVLIPHYMDVLLLYSKVYVPRTQLVR